MRELYEEDFYSWTKEQVKLLRSGELKKLDVENLIEEVEDLGNRHLDAIESYIIVLLTHLLKWKYQPDHKSGNWAGSITNSRRRIKRILKKNPGLKSKLSEIFTDDQFDDSKAVAISETGLEKGIFPKENPWTLEEILNDDFWPI